MTTSYLIEASTRQEAEQVAGSYNWKPEDWLFIQQSEFGQNPRVFKKSEGVDDNSLHLLLASHSLEAAVYAERKGWASDDWIWFKVPVLSTVVQYELTSFV